MKKKMIEGGFSSNKLIVLNNFIGNDYFDFRTSDKEDYYCYFGRISVEKGLATLLEVAKSIPFGLKIVGEGPSLSQYKHKYQNKYIHFLGYKTGGELKEVIERAKFTVIPSKCYENFPFSIVESFALGTPVLGASIGGIPELVRGGETGLTFEAGNSLDLKEKILYLLDNPDVIIEMGKNARKFVDENLNQEKYYKKLMNVYQMAMAKN